MATAKTFTASTEGEERPDIPFTLNGVYRRGREPADGGRTWAEDFTAYGDPPAAVLGAMRGAVMLDERGRQSINPAMVVDYIVKSLTPESVGRFLSLIESDDRLVRIELLGDVFSWLAEQVTGRPTQPSA